MRYALIAIAALVVLLGMQTVRLADAKSAHNEYVADVERSARAASDQARAEEQRLQQAINRMQKDVREQKATDDARAAELSADADRMRSETKQLLADRAALSARLAARGKTINDLTDLLAKLREEADDYAGQLAIALTASRRAGFACERAYDSLIKTDVQ